MIDAADDGVAAAKRFSAALSDRLRPVERRLRENAVLSGAGMLTAAGAIAVGAIQRRGTLASVGAEAVRFGCDRQLDAVRARTGFSIVPSVGAHGFSVMLTRN